MNCHDAVGAAACLTAGCAVATLIQLAMTAVAPAGGDPGLVAMTAGLAKVFATAAGATVVLWALASLERSATAEELADEIASYLETVPPSEGG